ncbi:MAG: hydroxymethylbilane synthase [Actinobacteria bacterium]|nr:hydroxymethylbilane synthase [Actinomycetota bacterium]
MSNRVFLLGTRGSLLATTQARSVADSLKSSAGFEISESIIRTEGDDTSTSLTKTARPGVFVSALREALITGEVDLIVHSYKDLPSLPEPGIVIAAVPQREDHRDALISRENQTLLQLPAGARVGTSSPRRAARISHLRPDLEVIPIRGNVDSRLSKVSGGEFEAAVLAAAGLNRVGYADKITEYFTVDQLLPAPAQGALAVECRVDDEQLIEALSFLEDPYTRLTTMAERAILVGISATCATAIGAYATYRDGTLHLVAELSASDADEHVRRSASQENLQLQDLSLAYALGLSVAREIMETELGSRLGSTRG